MQIKEKKNSHPSPNFLHQIHYIVLHQIFVNCIAKDYHDQKIFICHCLKSLRLFSLWLWGVFNCCIIESSFNSNRSYLLAERVADFTSLILTKCAPPFIPPPAPLSIQVEYTPCARPARPLCSCDTSALWGSMAVVGQLRALCPSHANQNAPR